MAWMAFSSLCSGLEETDKTSIFRIHLTDIVTLSVVSHRRACRVADDSDTEGERRGHETLKCERYLSYFGCHLRNQTSGTAIPACSVHPCFWEGSTNNGTVWRRIRTAKFERGGAVKSTVRLALIQLAWTDLLLPLSLENFRPHQFQRSPEVTDVACLLRWAIPACPPYRCPLGAAICPSIYSRFSNNIFLTFDWSLCLTVLSLQLSF
jgi:hypothetical protein